MQHKQPFWKELFHLVVIVVGFFARFSIAIVLHFRGPILIAVVIIVVILGAIAFWLK